VQPKYAASLCAAIVCLTVILLALGGLGMALLRENEANGRALRGVQNRLDVMTDPFLSGQWFEIDGLRTERYLGETEAKWRKRDIDARVEFFGK
jgi:hypothetical protein